MADNDALARVLAMLDNDELPVSDFTWDCVLEHDHDKWGYISVSGKNRAGQPVVLGDVEFRYNYGNDGPMTEEWAMSIPEVRFLLDVVPALLALRATVKD